MEATTPLTMEKENSPSEDQIKLIDSYAVNLIKQIYMALRDMGEMRRQKWHENFVHYSSIYEESVYLTLEEFLTQHQELRGEQMLELLSEAHQILKTGRAGVWSQEEEIYSVLEKMVALGDSRKHTDKIFDQITEVTAAMANGDFSKRIDHFEDERLSDQNLLNYIANAFNMLNEDLAETVLPKNEVVKKSVIQSIIHATGKAMVLFIADNNGDIIYISNHASILYGTGYSDMKSLINNYESVHEKTLIEGGLNHYPVFLSANKEKEIKALLSAHIAYSPSGEIDGIVYNLTPLPNVGIE